MAERIKATKGAINRVPCPWCGFKLDFRNLAGAGADLGYGSIGLERGTVIDCDKCGRKSTISGVRQITVISLVPKGSS